MKLIHKVVISTVNRQKSLLLWSLLVVVILIALIPVGMKMFSASNTAQQAPTSNETTTDSTYVPTETPAPTPVAPTISKTYDLVVIGSEVEGILMAKAAHDQGKSVLIIDPREKPGGQLIQGQMLVLDEPNTNKKKSLVQGEMKKLYNAYNAGDIRTEKQFIDYYNSLIQGIPLESGIQIEGIQQSDADANYAITSLTYKTTDQQSHTIAAKYWVENSDYNALTSKLHVTRIPGVESIFGGDKPEYMAATYMLRFKGVDWLKLHSATLLDYPLTNLEAKYGTNTYVDYDFGTGFNKITENFKSLDPQLKLRGINSTYQKNGEVIINALLIYDVDPASPESVQAAIAKGKAEAPRVLNFLKENIPGYEHAELNGFPDYLYIRDYNRFETDYVLSYEDVVASKMFWDNVSIGGYPMDIQGTRSVPTGKGYGKPDFYGIPLRSFELKSYDNVLVAGKNVGASIKAYGSARITPTTALAAETIGIILGHETKKLRDLNEEDFKRIHQYLSEDYNIKLD